MNPLSNIVNDLYLDVLKEERFGLTPENSPELYGAFKKEYEKSTGHSWTYDKFIQRANGWVFYGTPKGFIAAREQNSGFVKLAGMAGRNVDKVRGMREMLALKLPVWGMVSPDIAAMAKRYGFLAPPAFVVKLLMKVIPRGVFGKAHFTVTDSGSIKFAYRDVGEVEKVFIATKDYYLHLVKLYFSRASSALKAKLFSVAKGK